MPEILLAMFSPSISSKIYFGLTNRGFNCIEVADPQSMKNAVTSNKLDLIIISINHNENILKSFITALKNTEKFAKIPVLAVLNKSNIGEIDSVFNAGADECLSKPFKMTILLSKAEELIKSGISPVNNNERLIPETLEKHIERIKSEGRILGDISEIYTGASVSDHKAKRLSSPGSDWTPIIISEAIEPFYVGDEREFILMRKNLMRKIPQKKEYYVDEKVLLKRTVSPLAAAVDTTRTAFSSTLYCIQTAKGLSCSSLACILNSRYASFYFQRCRSCPDDLRSVYLSKSDVQQLPIILPNKKEQAILDKLYNEVAEINSKFTGKNKVVERLKATTAINNLVFKILGIDEAGIKIFNALHF